MGIFPREHRKLDRKNYCSDDAPVFQVSYRLFTMFSAKNDEQKPHLIIFSTINDAYDFELAVMILTLK